MAYPTDYDYRNTLRTPPAVAGSYDGTPQAMRILVDDFGSDETDRWRLIPKTFRAKYAYIGPQSEWDSCMLDGGGAVGPMPASVGNPVVLPFDGDITVRPYRQFGDVVTHNDAIQGRLDLIVLNYIPAFAPISRAPRVYPMYESAALDSTTETMQFLKTEWMNGAVRAVNQPLIIAGAKSFSLYLRNAEASAISWRVVGYRQNGQEYPISPTGYPTATPTYNTLAAGTNEAYHMDVETDAFEAIVLYAKSNAGGTVTLFHEVEVRDGF
jgi:hypothetical protein